MKKRIYFLFALLLVAFTVNAQNRDLNGDGVVDLSDVTDLIDYILNPPLTQTYTVNGVSFDMITMQGGTFTMGATEDQITYADNSEKPPHQVTLSTYQIGKTEVTQELWEAVTGKSLSQIARANGWTLYGDGPDYPMYYITWDDCQEFITKLNELTGQQFRMPTEAEWEYAARGGNKSKGFTFSGSNNIADVAWYSENSSNRSCPVANKAPNELGIYDMSGNVWEWCSDWYGDYSDAPQTNPTGPETGTEHVVRGGCWGALVSGSHLSNRISYVPTFHSNSVGLRLAQ